MARRPSRSRTKTSHDKSVRYAVLGLGHIAQAAVLPAFKHAQRNSVLAALVSGEEKKLKQLGRRYGVRRLCGYDGVDELFASGEIDAVYIALPNDMHKEYTVRAARAGLHVLCEKPMAVTVERMRADDRRDARANVKLMIAYRLHFERANLEVAKLARTGKLGDLRFFNSEFSMQVGDDNVRLNPAEKGGGPLYDIGIYCINAARYCFAEDPVEVWATATRSDDRRFREVDETVAATMRFKDERLATFVCSFGAADRSVYSITGTKGSVTLDPAFEYAAGLAYTLRTAGAIERRSSARATSSRRNCCTSRTAFSKTASRSPPARKDSRTCASSKGCCNRSRRANPCDWKCASAGSARACSRKSAARLCRASQSSWT